MPRNLFISDELQIPDASRSLRLKIPSQRLVIVAIRWVKIFVSFSPLGISITPHERIAKLGNMSHSTSIMADQRSDAVRHHIRVQASENQRWTQANHFPRP